VNKPLEWISRSRVRLAAAGRFQYPTSATHLDQLSASHHHLCSSCYHVDLHSSSLLRIDAHCDVVVSPHTDTHHSIVLLLFHHHTVNASPGNHRFLSLPTFHHHGSVCMRSGERGWWMLHDTEALLALLHHAGSSNLSLSLQSDGTDR
jgi:hypothetical protein